MLGKEVVGIWLKDFSNVDVNCVYLSYLGIVFVIGDDFGFVKLFDFFCFEVNVSEVFLLFK